jgi:hypothetical protein
LFREIKQETIRPEGNNQTPRDKKQNKSSLLTSLQQVERGKRTKEDKIRNKSSLLTSLQQVERGKRTKDVKTGFSRSDVVKGGSGLRKTFFNMDGL